MIICPNEACLRDIDVSPVTNEGWSEADGDVTYAQCPYCNVSIRVTTRIVYSGEVVTPTALPPEEQA